MQHHPHAVQGLAGAIAAGAAVVLWATGRLPDGALAALGLLTWLAGLWLIGRRTRPAPLRRYRVEHRYDGRVALVAPADDPLGPLYALGRQAAQLAARGAPGEVVLVDDATGEVVARRRLPVASPTAVRTAES